MGKTLVDLLDENRANAIDNMDKMRSYGSMVEYLVNLHAMNTKYHKMDKSRITVIDYGEYQGYLVFIVAEDSYQPFKHWYVRIGYGSCSGCDALEDAIDYNDNRLSEQSKEKMYKILHDIASSFRLMNDNDLVAEV